MKKQFVGRICWGGDTVYFETEDKKVTFQDLFKYIYDEGYRNSQIVVSVEKVSNSWDINAGVSTEKPDPVKEPEVREYTEDATKFEIIDNKPDLSAIASEIGDGEEVAQPEVEVEAVGQQEEEPNEVTDEPEMEEARKPKRKLKRR